jgi:hypothetical protein
VHKIFLIHRMGNWMPGWSADIQKAIRSYYDSTKYQFLAKWPFDNQFQFVEINYNNLFQEYLDAAKKQADQLGSWSKLAHPIESGVFDVLDNVVKAASTPPHFTVVDTKEPSHEQRWGRGRRAEIGAMRFIRHRVAIRSAPENL